MSIDRGMDKEDVVHIYNGILLSHRKEWNKAICSNMDATRDYHTKWSKSERHHMISLICGISSMAQMNLSTKQKQTYRHIRLVVAKVDGWEGEGWTGNLGLVDANYYI